MLEQQDNAVQRLNKLQKDLDRALKEHDLTVENLARLSVIQQEVQELKVEAQREIWEQAIGDIAHSMHISVEVSGGETALLRNLIEQVLNGVREVYTAGLQGVSNEEIIQRISLKDPE